MPLSQKDLATIEALAGIGLTMDKIALCLGMCKKTLERRIKDTEGAKVALEKGRAQSEMSVAKTAFEMAKDGKVPAMTMFWLKCRAGWKETSVHQHEGGDPSRPIKTETVKKKLDPEKRRRRIMELAQAVKALNGEDDKAD